MQHRVRQRRGFAVSHTVQKNRHQQRGALIVGDLARSHAIDEELDLFSRQFSTVTLFANDILWAQLVLFGNVVIRSCC